MKKVWVINHYAVPPQLGTFIRQFQFAKNLKEKYEFEIFSSSQIHNSNLNISIGGNFITTQHYDDIKFNFIKNKAYQDNSIKRIYNMVEFAFKLLFLIKKKYGKPDIVYLSSPCLIASFFGLIVGKLKKAKIIIEIRDIWPYSIIEYSKRMTTKNLIIRFLSLIEKIIYKNSDAIIFTMPGGKQYIKDRNWEKEIKNEKIYYINNGVDLFEYNNSIKEVDDVDLASSKKKFVYTGSIRKANGIMSLVKAFEKLKSTDNILLIYGSGNEINEVIKYIEENKIKNIKYKGKVDKALIPSILSKADFNILTYLPLEKSLVRKYGSSQNKMFEYLASGKPIISNQEYGEYDILKIYKCGIVKQCNTEDDYVALLKEADTYDKEKYDILKENTKKAIINFDWKILTEKLEEVFLYILT